MKSLELEKIKPVFSYMILKIPNEVHTSASGIDLDLKTRNKKIDQYIADGSPLEVIAVGPQVEAYKVGDSIMFSNLSYPAQIAGLGEKGIGDYWMCRESDGAMRYEG